MARPSMCRREAHKLFDETRDLMNVDIRLNKGKMSDFQRHQVKWHPLFPRYFLICQKRRR